MAGKRFQGDHGCCRDRADGSCALAMVGRLSEERVRELAEDIWTASIDRVVPARPSPDARPRRGSRSLQRYERSWPSRVSIFPASSRPRLRTALQYFSKNLTVAATS
jgi:hypothetical protein